MILAIAIITVFGGTNVIEGRLLVGTLIAFTLYIQDFFDPIRALTMEYAQLQRAMASGARVFELLDVKPDLIENDKAVTLSRIKGDITFNNVSFRYQSSTEVLHHVNLDIQSGETVALVGPTGAGKSTIISLIARFYDVTEGQILIDNHDIREIDLTTYRRQLGVVFQDPFLFSGTIHSNICYANQNATEEEMVAAAKAVNAHEFISKLEKGYDTLLYERGQNLSMGQRQLISFARALLANPAILLLDEATSNVDSYSENLLQKAMESLLKGRTALVIAHRLSTVRNADHILVMDKGQIVEEGNHQKLLQLGGLYARLYLMASSSS
jgi:ABC-type multidrug transport system fused ATPase/permease subunit